MNKNLTVKMGNRNPRKYIPRLVDLIEDGAVTPSKVLTQQEPLTDVIEAHKVFDHREAGWVKVELQPAGLAAQEMIVNHLPTSGVSV